MLNTHNLKIKGLKAASGNTCSWSGHTQISYDMSTGEVYTNDHVGNSWSEYHDADVITVCNTSRHMSMQEIADRIAEAVAWEQQCRASIG